MFFFVWWATLGWFILRSSLIRSFLILFLCCHILEDELFECQPLSTLPTPVSFESSFWQQKTLEIEDTKHFSTRVDSASLLFSSSTVCVFCP